MHPDPFTISMLGQTLNIPPYGMFLVLAVSVVVCGSWWALKRDGISHRMIILLLSASTCAAFVGARVLNGILYADVYRADASQWLTLDTEGFSLYGGVLAAIVVGALLARHLHIRAWRAADRMVPFVGIGIALIRVGCFLQGCCYGKETSMPWGVHFPLFSPAHRHQLVYDQDVLNIVMVHPVHPTQLYELFAALLAAVVAWVFLRKKLPDGVAALMFALVFTVARFVIYFFHDTTEFTGIMTFFYPALYILLIALALTLLFRRMHKK